MPAIDINEALKQLHDVHAPPPVAAWPPGPGWWFVAGLLVLLLIGLGVWLWRRHRDAWRRAALAECRRIADEERVDDEAAAQWLNLLRRVAVHTSTTEESRRLSGAQWAAWIGARADDADIAANVLLLEKIAFAGSAENGAALDRTAMQASIARVLRRWPRAERRAPAQENAPAAGDTGHA